MYIFFFLVNFICYFLILKIAFIIFKNNYIFPFRIADLFGFIVTLFTFTFIAHLNYNLEVVLVTFFINVTFFVIFFFLLSMIYTSPRTKILLDLFVKKKINKKKYLKYYNANRIVDNRIKRLKTNNEVIVKKKTIKLNNSNNRITLLRLVIFVFEKMKTI